LLAIEKIDHVLNPNLWSLTNHQVGLNKNINLLESYKSELLGISKKNNSSANLKPCMLGFMSNNPNKNKDISYVVFDVPPLNNVNNYSHIYDDCLQSLEFSRKFLEDFYKLSEELNLNIYIKPKYNINNYDHRYKSVLMKFFNKGLLLDPYSDVGDILKKVKIFFSTPYTSVNRIFTNSKNYYYISEDFSKYIYTDSKLIIGYKNLIKKINEK